MRVAAAVLLALLVLVQGNEENACDRSQLPWDLDVVTFVEREMSREEVHLTGEYRLYVNGEEQPTPGGGVVHNMKICSPCTEDSYFRFTVSPHGDFDFSLTMKDGAGLPLLVSEEGGKGTEKTVAMPLAAGESYSVDIRYDSEAVQCSAVFIELALRPGDLVHPCQEGLLPIGSNGESINFNYSEGTDTRYTFETTMDHPRPTATGTSLDFDGFMMVAPHLPGHDDQWRFRLDLRTDFIAGGDLTAMVSNQKTLPDIKDCNTFTNGEAVECIFGARGRWKNTYSVDMTIRSNTVWYVHFFRRGRDSDMDSPPTSPPCVEYWFKAQLRAETLQENFISCDALPLPESLNMPGYYDERTGEMALDMELLLSTSDTLQSATVEVAFASLLKLTVSHEDIDVDVQLFKRSDLVANSEGILSPEGITAQLQKGVQYIVTVKHNFDYVTFEDGWKPNCNKALLRMEITKAPSDTCEDENYLPNISFTQNMHNKSGLSDFVYNYQPPVGQQETISSWEFTLSESRLFQVHVPHVYANGEVAATLISMHDAPLQLTQFAFITDDGIELNDETVPQHGLEMTVLNPGGSSPAKEAPENVVKSSKYSKWLDFNTKPLVFDFKSKITISKFKFVTGNDYENRDPVQWVIYGSDTEDWETDGKVLHSQETDYATPLLRRHPSPDIAFDQPETYRYFVFKVTATRDYQTHKDVTFADSDLNGAYLSKVLTFGRYRFSLLTGWGDVYPKNNNENIPKCLRFGLEVLIEDSTCPLKRLPSDLGVVTSKAYLFGEYRVPGSKEHTISFKVATASMLNLDIVNGAVNVTSVVLASTDGTPSSEDYYGNGLHWMMRKLKADTDYTLTLKFGGEVMHCDNMNVQISIMELPSNAEGTKTYPDIGNLVLNTGGDHMVLPYHHDDVYAFGADKHDHVHNEFTLTEAAELRVLLHFNFEFLHVYVDICQCTSATYDICNACGKGRGYSIFNGNHLEAQTLPAGHYIMKFYETSFSEDKANRVSYYNAFEVTLHMEQLDKQTDEQTMCGHQALPTHLNGPGMLSERSLEPNTMHTIAEVLVPEPVVGADPPRQSVTRFDVHTLSMFRLWAPLKEGLGISARLLKLASAEGKHADPWPAGSPPGNSGVRMNTEEAMFHVLPHGFYQLTLIFDTDISLDCLTYDIELSLTPLDSDSARQFNTTCPEDSAFPSTMSGSAHDLKYRSIPDKKTDGEESGHRFRHIIPFEVKSELGGRVDLDLVSTFESGGLTAIVRDADTKEPVLFPIRYLHRDFLQQDIKRGKYEVVVQDMASQAQNKLFVDLSGQQNLCNRYSVHLRYDDYTTDVDKCTLDVTDKIPEDAIAGIDTKSNLMFYNNVKFPQQTRQLEFNFEVWKTDTLFKVWAHTRSPTIITASLLLRGNVVASGSNVDGSSLLNAPSLDDLGLYTLRLVFDVAEVALDLSCDEEILYSTFDFAVGYRAGAMAAGLFGPASCTTSATPPPEITLSTLPQTVFSNYQLAANDRNEYYNSMAVHVPEELKGGNFYIVFKWNWLITDAQVEMTHPDGQTLAPIMQVDSTAEESYTSVLRIRAEIESFGEYTMTISGLAAHRGSCLPFYLSVVGTPKDNAETASFEVVDPWSSRDVIPTEPLVIRLVLSATPKPSSTRDGKFVFLEDADGMKVYPSRIGIDKVSTVLKLYFDVTYSKAYNLKFQPEKLQSSTGIPFTADHIKHENMQYTTAACLCVDAIHCDWGSPCGVPSCSCRMCPAGALPLSSTQKTCERNLSPTTPMPTSKAVPTPQPTKPPATPTPSSHVSPPEGTPAPTHAPTTQAPDTESPGTSGGSKGGGNAWIIVVILVLLMAGLVFLAHKKGFVSVPCLDRTSGPPRMVRMADDSLFMDDDEDEETILGAGGEDPEEGGDQPMLEIREEEEVPQVAETEPPQAEAAPQPPQEAEADPFAGLDFSAPAPAARAEP